MSYVMVEDNPEKLSQEERLARVKEFFVKGGPKPPPPKPKPKRPPVINISSTAGGNDENSSLSPTSPRSPDQAEDPGPVILNVDSLMQLSTIMEIDLDAVVREQEILDSQALKDRAALSQSKGLQSRRLPGHLTSKVPEDYASRRRAQTYASSQMKRSRSPLDETDSGQATPEISEEERKQRILSRSGISQGSNPLAALGNILKRRNSLKGNKSPKSPKRNLTESPRSTPKLKKKNSLEISGAEPPKSPKGFFNSLRRSGSRGSGHRKGKFDSSISTTTSASTSIEDLHAETSSIISLPIHSTSSRASNEPMETSTPIKSPIKKADPVDISVVSSTSPPPHAEPSSRVVQSYRTPVHETSRDSAIFKVASVERLFDTDSSNLFGSGELDALMGKKENSPDRAIAKDKMQSSPAKSPVRAQHKTNTQKDETKSSSDASGSMRLRLQAYEIGSKTTTSADTGHVISKKEENVVICKKEENVAVSKMNSMEKVMPKKKSNRLFDDNIEDDLFGTSTPPSSTIKSNSKSEIAKKKASLFEDELFQDNSQKPSLPLTKEPPKVLPKKAKKPVIGTPKKRSARFETSESTTSPRRKATDTSTVSDSLKDKPKVKSQEPEAHKDKPKVNTPEHEAHKDDPKVKNTPEHEAHKDEPKVKNTPEHETHKDELKVKSHEPKNESKVKSHKHEAHKDQSKVKSPEYETRKDKPKVKSPEPRKDESSVKSPERTVKPTVKSPEHEVPKKTPLDTNTETEKKREAKSTFSFDEDSELPVYRLRRMKSLQGETDVKDMSEAVVEVKQAEEKTSITVFGDASDDLPPFGLIRRGDRKNLPEIKTEPELESKTDTQSDSEIGTRSQGENELNSKTNSLFSDFDQMLETANKDTVSSEVVSVDDHDKMTGRLTPDTDPLGVVSKTEVEKESEKRQKEKEANKKDNQKGLFEPSLELESNTDSSESELKVRSPTPERTELSKKLEPKQSDKNETEPKKEIGKSSSTRRDRSITEIGTSTTSWRKQTENSALESKEDKDKEPSWMSQLKTRRNPKSDTDSSSNTTVKITSETTTENDSNSVPDWQKRVIERRKKATEPSKTTKSSASTSPRPDKTLSSSTTETNSPGRSPKSSLESGSTENKTTNRSRYARDKDEQDFSKSCDVSSAQKRLRKEPEKNSWKTTSSKDEENSKSKEETDSSSTSKPSPTEKPSDEDASKKTDRSSTSSVKSPTTSEQDVKLDSKTGVEDDVFTHKESAPTDVKECTPSPKVPVLLSAVLDTEDAEESSSSINDASTSDKPSEEVENKHESSTTSANEKSSTDAPTSQHSSVSSEQDNHSHSVSHSRSPTPTTPTGPLKLPDDPDVPVWKKRLLEKRKTGEASKSPSKKPLPSTTEKELPAWRKELLAKKQVKTTEQKSNITTRPGRSVTISTTSPSITGTGRSTASSRRNKVQETPAFMKEFQNKKKTQKD